MDATTKKELMKIACKIRMGVIEGTFHAKSGHPGGSLSIAEDLSYLYWREMNVDPKNPKMENRDRLVLSKGHTAPALYAALALKGFFPESELKSLRHIGSMLQGHPDMKHIPGDSYRTYTIVGDGEIEEGQVWEAAMFASHYKLDNLVAVVDNNNLQIDGTVEEVMSPYPIPEKFAAFGWHVITIDAHNFDEIEKAFEEAKTVKGKPTVIVQKSIKGKGVSFMENQVGWHGSAPNAEQYEQALKELRDTLNDLD